MDGCGTFANLSSCAVISSPSAQKRTGIVQLKRVSCPQNDLTRPTLTRRRLPHRFGIYSGSGLAEQAPDENLRITLDLPEVFLAAEAFCIDLIDSFSP